MFFYLIGRDIGTLDLSGNNLRTIPPDVGKLKTLVKLDMSRNGLRCMHANDYTGLPQEMAGLTNLQYLNISECNLPYIPPVIWKLVNLKELDISRNKINMLVPEVGNLMRLRHLNAQQTNISTLPAEIAFCQELEELLMWGNVIESLPETLKELPNLKKLAINYRSFATMVVMENLLKKGQIQSEHIPPVLFEMSCLHVLDLEGTKINSLPDVCIAKLTEFYINKNYFMKIPQMIFGIDTLVVLDISDNMITTIPDEIEKLTGLITFRANNNNFETIPTTIGSLQNLVELAMGGNALRMIPNQVGQLKNLKTLILDRNEIQSIPDSLIQLTQLETLDLTGNQIKALPIKLYKMTGLKAAHSYQKFHKYGLWLHKNPLITPPQEVWQTENPEQIYRYLKKLQIKQTENLQRQKLILLGEAQCGKTSLTQTMVTGKSNMTSGIQESTRVIDYTIWTTENDVEFMLMDMGGHDVYQMLHPMFMDKKALFLIVYDHRLYRPENHQDHIGKWIELVYLYAPGAVVKVVATHCDLIYDNMVESNLQVVQEQVASQIKEMERRVKEEAVKLDQRMKQMNSGDKVYSLLKKQRYKMEAMISHPLRMTGVSLVSCAEGIMGIMDLITKLEIMAVNKNLFPHAQKYIPEYWIRFRNQLKLNKKGFLNWEQVVKMSYKYSMKSDTAKECIQFLCDIGEVLWFPVIPALKDFIFHRPRSLVEILRCIFRHDRDEYLNFNQNRVFAHKGGFTEDTFKVAVAAFKKYGQISRQMLQCLWFYLKLDYNEFMILQEWIPKLGVCYVIPQPDLPAHKGEFIPLMVMPGYNLEPRPNDLNELWPEEVPSDIKEVSIYFLFPLHYPHGLFERFICRIQNHIDMRLDWHDFIYAEVDDIKLAILQQLHPESYDLEFKLTVRGKHDLQITHAITFLCQDLYGLMSLCPGLIWYITYQSANGAPKNVEEWFPKGLFEVHQEMGRKTLSKTTTK